MNLDWVCASWVHAHQNPSLRAAMAALSAVTGSKACCIAAAAVAGLWLFRGRFTRGAILFFGTALSAILVEILKGVFQRDRPPFSNIYDSYSFPSGHALSSTVFFGLLAWSFGLDFPARRKVFGGMAAASAVGVGCSRIYLGVHWPTDVIGGIVMGILFMKGWLWCAEKQSS